MQCIRRTLVAGFQPHLLSRPLAFARLQLAPHELPKYKCSFSTSTIVKQATDQRNSIDEPEPGDGDNDCPDDEVHKILFTYFCDALQTCTKSIRTDQLIESYRRHNSLGETPPKTLKQDHDAFWRDVYRQIRTYAAKEPITTVAKPWTKSPKIGDLPVALQRSGPITDPPIHDLSIFFVDKLETVSCPCCLQTELMFELRLQTHHAQKMELGSGSALSEQGVTFDMLLQELSTTLHGSDDGSRPRIGGPEDQLQLDSFQWMISDRGLHTNEIYVYVGGCSTWN